MKECAARLISGILAALIFVPPLHVHGAQPKKLRLAFSAFAYANPPFWIAQELKLFEKYGYDSELIYVGGSRPIQAMLGGSVDVSQVGGAAAVGAAANGAEIAISARYLPGSLSPFTPARRSSRSVISRAKLSPRERRAATATSRHWRFSDISGRVANRDVGVLSAGGSPEVLAGLRTGRETGRFKTRVSSRASASRSIRVGGCREAAGTAAVAIRKRSVGRLECWSNGVLECWFRNQNPLLQYSTTPI